MSMVNDINKCVRNQIASAMMEGIEFSDENLELVYKIANNEITIDNAIEIIRNKNIKLSQNYKV